MEKILQYIETGIKEGGRLVAGGKRVGTDGYFIEPTVIADVDPMATISQEEIFGPVMAIIKAKNFDHALEIANNTEFGLTGGVWTKNKKKQEKAKNEFHAGNFYINRKITGALVGVRHVSPRRRTRCRARRGASRARRRVDRARRTFPALAGVRDRRSRLCGGAAAGGRTAPAGKPARY